MKMGAGIGGDFWTQLSPRTLDHRFAGSATEKIFANYLKKPIAFMPNGCIVGTVASANAQTAPRDQGLEKIMTTVFYTAIRPANGQSVASIIRTAQTIGYTMVKFNGWTDDDLGPSGMPGPRRAEAKVNLDLLNEIQDACEEVDGDFPHIVSTSGPHPVEYIVG